MKSIVLQAERHLSIQKRSFPAAPSPGHALVKTLKVGVCGTDLHAYRGTFPFMEYPRILGHELCVEVLATVNPGDSRVSVGDICAVEPYMNCGDCYSCGLGKYNCCSSLKVIGIHSDGGMCEQFLIPISKLHVANDVQSDQLAIVEMLAIGAHAVRRSGNLEGQNVLVLGMGPIGLGVANFAKIAGANVAVVDRSRFRLDFACRRHGVQGIISNGDLPDGIRSYFGDLPSTVFDATGNMDSMQHSFELANFAGQLVFVGLVRDNISFNNPLFHSHEMTLKSSRNATADDFKFVIETLRDGRSKVQDWITHSVSPESFVQEIDNWLDPEFGVIKGVVDFT